MTREKWTPAFRRYQFRAAFSMAAYVITLFAVAFIMRHPPSGPLRYVLAVVPALCIVGVIVALGRYLAEESDEYQRYLVVVRILWGTGGTLVATTVWGFLETYAEVPHLPLYMTSVIWFFCFGLAACITRWSAR
jgi:hypothetical protein